ncbi:hypothetical protein ACFVYR_23180 [Streptomyces sp. NPDC058284]|uniref:hypothetical protein n=1 Tax=unclassified Streptomyces TaxID=2593676 RepID=UPI00364E43AC
MPQPKPKPAPATSAPPAKSRRKDAATHLLRGTCYGLGTGLVSLAARWIQQHD